MPMLKNVRHERFAQLIFSGKSQRKAYLEAYPESQKSKVEMVDNRAYLLNARSEISVRLNELLEESMDSIIMEKKERMAKLSEIARDVEEEEGTGDRIKAIDVLNKMDGVYTNKVELTGQVEIGIEDKEKAAENYIRELLSDG
jgi:hypothetical protein